MRVLFDDADLDGKFQRTLTHAYARAADPGEALAAARRITPGDDQSCPSARSVQIIARYVTPRDVPGAAAEAGRAGPCPPQLSGP